MNGSGQGKVYEFKGFRLDGAQRRFLHDGRPVQLKAKIFDLLLFLVERRGQLVDKDELMREVWPNTIVEENNITVSMSILRKTLGEGVDGRQFIETVPRRGYRFVADVREISLGANEATAISGQVERGQSSLREAPIDSLAVLPIHNVSKDMSGEYLSKGITESIINSLSQVPSLRVMACSTGFRFKGKEVDPQEVGMLLNVRALMLVRVIQLGKKLIIRSELVKVSDGSQIWGEQYERTSSDLLAIQDEIAKAIVESLKFKLTLQQQKRLTKRYTDNIEAYNLYLRGRYFWTRYSKEWVLKSIEAFKQAIEIDSSYALAYSGMADAYFRLSNIHLPPSEVMPKAREAALKAVEIDDELAEAHSSLGLVRVYYDHDWVAAEREFKRCLELNPDLVLGHQRYGSYLAFIGRFDESNAHYQRALELDPFSLQINMNLATNLYLMGEYERAINLLEKTLDLEPDYIPTHYVLGCTYIQQGDFDKAVAEFQFIYKLDEEAYMALGFMGYTYALAGQRAEAENLLNILKDLSLRKHVSPYSMVVIQLGLGLKDQVLEMLERLYEERSEWLVWLKVSPELKELREELAFKDLLSRVGFPNSIA
ncbi:MAG TPA: winged helix-turn-helix domain-containing protein [Pyrinomonadaceae bacterium]|nr:winged helix-turn-helix domain-containing protein [Pyrinomonadaceae bacterium]